MKIRIRFLLVLPLLLLGGCGGSASWKEFTSPEGKFRVLMYGQPKEETQEYTNGKAHIFEVAPRKGVVYSVIYFDPQLDPKEKANPDFIEKTLNVLCVNSEERLKGKIETAKRVQLQNHQGREVLIDAPDAITYRMRCFLVNDRCYQVVVAGSKDAVSSAEADQFMNSFRTID